MGKIYIKHINGRDYKYERISSKRVGDKVVTKDVCRGPVVPAKAKMESIPAKRLTHYKNEFASGEAIADIRSELARLDNIHVSETTIRTYFKSLGVPRGRTDYELRQTRSKEERVHKQKKVASETEHRFKILMEEKRLTGKQIVKIGSGKGLNKKLVDAAWKKRG